MEQVRSYPFGLAMEELYLKQMDVLYTVPAAVPLYVAQYTALSFPHKLESGVAKQPPVMPELGICVKSEFPLKLLVKSFVVGLI